MNENDIFYNLDGIVGMWIGWFFVSFSSFFIFSLLYLISVLSLDRQGVMNNVFEMFSLWLVDALAKQILFYKRLKHMSG